MERPTSSDDGPNDRSAAARAWLARAVIHLELLLHPTLAAARVAVVAARRAAETDALAQHEADRLAQPRDLIGTQRARGPQRMDARPPEGLDGVDVPDTGDRALIEKQRLDRGASASLQ